MVGQVRLRLLGGFEVEVEGLGRVGPLRLQVLGRRDDQQAAAGVLAEVLAGGGQREGGLAGARGRDREEIGPRPGLEGFERGALPASS